MTALYESQTSVNKLPVGPAGLAYDPHQEAPSPVLGAQEIEVIADAERQMVQSEAGHEATLREIAAHYVMPNDFSVQSFLRSHRAIPQLLIEAVPHLRQCFGGNAIVALQAPTDESGAQVLYGLVMWPGAANEVRRSMERFHERWWIAHSRQASGYLSFTFELV